MKGILKEQDILACLPTSEMKQSSLQILSPYSLIKSELNATLGFQQLLEELKSLMWQ